jgi:hypothetical protein
VPLAAVLRGRRASSTPLIKDQPEVGNSVAEQVEVGLNLVQMLRLKLLKQPLGSPREPSCIMQCLGGRKAGAKAAPQAAPVDPFHATADSRVDEIVAPVAEATAEAAVRHSLQMVSSRLAAVSAIRQPTVALGPSDGLPP